MHKLIVIILLILQFFNLSSQNNDQKNNIIQYFDSIYGADNLLINGRIYTYPNMKAKGDPYFYGKEFKQATIFINQRKYTDLVVNYNIADDILILLAIINNNEVSIEMNNHFIDSFYISYKKPIRSNVQSTYTFPGNQRYNDNPGQIVSTHKFIKSKKFGFCEKINTEDYQMWIKYYKKFSSSVSENYQYGYYTDQIAKLYLSKDNNIIDVSKKKVFLKTFKNNKKEIKKYLKKRKIKKINTATYSELVKLMDYCQKIKDEKSSNI